jgi:chromosome segregation ATPase
MPRPLSRARYIRWRLLKMLADVRDLRITGEQTREQLLGLQDAIAGSERQVAALATSLARVEATVQSSHLEHREVKTLLDDIQRQLQRQGRVLELIYEDEANNHKELSRLRRSRPYAEAFTDPEPLVSVIIPTYLNHDLLVTSVVSG